MNKNKTVKKEKKDSAKISLFPLALRSVDLDVSYGRVNFIVITAGILLAGEHARVRVRNSGREINNGALNLRSEFRVRCPRAGARPRLTSDGRGCACSRSLARVSSARKLCTKPAVVKNLLNAVRDGVRDDATGTFKGTSSLTMRKLCESRTDRSL